MILAFSIFRLDGINLNNARSVSSNQNSYMSVTKLHKISRKNISSLMLAFSVCCVFSLPGSGLKPQKGHEKVLACTPPSGKMPLNLKIMAVTDVFSELV